MKPSDKSRVSDLKLAGTAHDLNNVFQTLMGIAAQLDEQSGTAALSTAILRSVERGQHIVACLHGSAAEPAPFESILSNAEMFLSDYLVASHGPKVQISRAIASDIHLNDPWAWERVLTNLFLNSARAMTHGGTIHVEARHHVGGIEITVADEGSGIAANMLDHLFEPHRSAHGSTGLGLSIVESIVHANGGRVRASNRKDIQGAILSITLPLKVASAAAPVGK